MKEKLFKFWVGLRGTVGLPAMIIAALMLGYFGYSYFRDWRQEVELGRQRARIDEYSERTEAAVENANQYLDIADKNNRTTSELLLVVKGLTENVKTLAEKDRIVEFRVNDLRKDYETKRNQKRNNPVRSNLSVRQREERALSADRELYPN